MKRQGFLLAVVLAVLFCLPAMGEETKVAFQYRVRSGQEFSMRKEPGSEHRVKKVGKGQRLRVLEYGDEWCKVIYDREIGWAKTEWLIAFHTVDNVRFPVPGYAPVIGFIEPNDSIHVEAGKFPGIDVQKGNRIFVDGAAEDGYHLPVWRAGMIVRGNEAAFTPITAPDSAMPGDIIAGYTTFFHPKQGGYLAERRRTNIEVGCRLLAGTVVRPGESFSFNAVCGMYTDSKGYVIGPAINDTGEGRGGGVCQVSTTLYNALLSLPVTVTEVETHQVLGVDYVPVGMDSAVSVFSDLAFVNTLPYTIQLDCYPQGGALTAVITRAAE